MAALPAPYCHQKIYLTKFENTSHEETPFATICDLVSSQMSLILCESGGSRCLQCYFTHGLSSAVFVILICVSSVRSSLRTHAPLWSTQFFNFYMHPTQIRNHTVEVPLLFGQYFLGSMKILAKKPLQICEGFCAPTQQLSHDESQPCPQDVITPFIFSTQTPVSFPFVSSHHNSFHI